MSRRRKIAPTYTSRRTYLWFGGAVSVALVTLYLASRPPAYSSWKQSPAHVLGTRIVNAGLREGGVSRPGTALYRAEAHVTYIALGKPYDVWLPASETVADRAWLAFRLSKRDTDRAEVFWNPRDPAQGRVSLHLPYP